MCDRRDSIAAVSAAADRLGEVCETAMHRVRIADPSNPARSGIGRALRTAIRDLSVTPIDMAMSLRRVK